MRHLAALSLGLLVLSSALQAQQPQAKPTPVPTPPIVIYRIDLLPTGSAFAMNEPVLEGDVYVFRSLPERRLERLPKTRVKAIVRRSTDFSKEVVWQLDLEPSGVMLVRDEPVQKGKAYIVTRWKDGALLSIPQADVRKVTKLTGIPAFRAQEIDLGVVLLEGDLPDGAGGGTVRGSNAAPGAAPAPGSKPASGNWTYQGQPGASDAYAPASGVVARPGDLPMAPTQGPR